MTVHNRTASAHSRDLVLAHEESVPLFTINTCFGPAADQARRVESAPREPEISSSFELSVRALNVLKLLAAEMTGEDPPRTNWVPPDALLRELTFERLSCARNCGPLTIEEIVRWAGARGIVIAPRSCAGRSFPKIWHELEARFTAGELTRAEIAEALERSVHRKNTKVP